MLSDVKALHSACQYSPGSIHYSLYILVHACTYPSPLILQDSTVGRVCVHECASLMPRLAIGGLHDVLMSPIHSLPLQKTPCCHDDCFTVTLLTSLYNVCASVAHTNTHTHTHVRIYLFCSACCDLASKLLALDSLLSRENCKQINKETNRTRPQQYMMVCLHSNMKIQ